MGFFESRYASQTDQVSPQTAQRFVLTRWGLGPQVRRTLWALACGFEAPPRQNTGLPRLEGLSRLYQPNGRHVCPLVLNELDIVRDVSEKLERGGIAYMLTGSMAMNYYAQPRMTRDIDLVVGLSPSHVDRLLSLFTPDYYVSPEAIMDSIRRESLFNLVHQDSVIKVDCIVRKSSPYRRTEFDRRRQITIEDFSTWIVSKEDLIISKLDWARDSRSELQLRDVRNLASTDCDEDYIRRWTAELGLQALWEQCRK